MKKIEIWITGIILTVVILIVSTLTINFSNSKFGLYEDSEFWKNILVEAHGFILDVFLIGFILVLIMNRFDRKREINDLHNIIEFNRHIKTEQAKYTIFSSIVLLNKLKQTKIDLHQCDLSELIMSKIKLTGSSIHAVSFLNTNLKEAELKKIKGERPKFINTNLKCVDFSDSKFNRAEFKNVNARSIKFIKGEIIRTRFIDSDLNNADFRNSTIDNTNFERTILKNADFRNCKFKTGISFVDSDLQSTDFIGSINIPVSEIIKAKNLKKAKFDQNVLNDLMRLDPSLII